MSVLSRWMVYKPAQVKDHPIRNGTIFLALFGLGLFIALAPGGLPLVPKGGTVLRAEFKNAANVTAGKTPVRVRGIDVGQVEKVERQPDGRGVIITMRLNKDAGDFTLRKDARADILWRTLLGFSFYIQLEPGSDPAPLGDATIPESRTTTQVEADQVLASLDKPSRAGLQTLFREFDKGFNGGGAPGLSLDRLAPSMRQVGPGLSALRGTQPGDLTQTVRQASRFMGALARSEKDLGEVIANADTTLGVTAARRADLDRTFAEAPAALDQTRATMTTLRGTFDTLDPVARKLRPGARKLDDAAIAVRPALRDLRPLLSDARPLLRDLRPALRSLRAAANRGTPLMHDLEPAVARANATILPGLEQKDDETQIKAYEAIGPTIATVDDSAAQWDANGFTQRFNAVAGGERTFAALPCSSNLYKGTVNCDDVVQVLYGLLGMPPPRKGARGLATRPPRGDANHAAQSAGGVGSGVRRLVDFVDNLFGGGR